MLAYRQRERERERVPPVSCCTVYSSHLQATMTTTSEWVHSNKKNTMGPYWKVQTVHFLILNTSLEFHQICPWLEDWVSHCYWRLDCWIIQVQSFQMASFLWTSFWCQYQKATGCILHLSLVWKTVIWSSCKFVVPWEFYPAPM
jgi:hypothetical protein